MKIVFILTSALLVAARVRADDERLATLQVRGETYTNVTVTAVSATEIFFTHSRGLGNAKLKNLVPELQKKFYFDPIKAVEKEAVQAQANAQFLAKIASEPHEVSVHAAPDEAVSVDMADPIAEYKYYDLSRGKPPQIHEGMLGNASPIFKCTTDFTIQPVKGRSSGPFKFRFMSASLSIELPITITLPTGTSPGLREHEEGHRKINEYFYTLGRKSAQHAGGLVL